MNIELNKYAYEIVVLLSLLVLFCLKKQRDFKDSNFLIYVGIILGAYYYMKKQRKANYVAPGYAVGTESILNKELPPFRSV